MTWRDVLIIAGAVSLTLAALALALAIRAAWRRPVGARLWSGLVWRGLLVALLVAVGGTCLVNLPPPEMVNQSAPAQPGAQVVFVPASRYGLTRTLQAVSARDGSPRWSQTLPNSIGVTLYPNASVVVAAVAYNALYGMRASDGAIIWRYPIKDYLPTIYIAADSARVYFLASTAPNGRGSFDVVALDLATGAAAWREPLPAAITNPHHLTLAGGVVYAVGDAAAPPAMDTTWTIIALDAATGAQRWQASGGSAAPDPANIVTNLLVAGGMALVVRQRGPVTALRVADGAVVWADEPRFGAGDPAQIYAAAADTDTLYVIAQPSNWPKDAHGNPIEPASALLALDAATGAIRWRVAAANPSSSWTQLAVSDGVVLEGTRLSPDAAWIALDSTSEGLFAYDATSGRSLWTARGAAPTAGVGLGFASLGDPRAAGDVLYLAGVGHDPYVADACVVFCPGVFWLYAINVHTGAPWWRARMGYASLTHFVF